MSMDNGTPGRRANLVLIGKRQAKGWGRGRAARELHRLWNEHFTGAPAAESIVKSIRRHETGEVQVRDEIYRKLYCLAYDSSPHELFGSIESETPARDSYRVRSHKFIPAFIGVDGVTRILSRQKCEPDEGLWLNCEPYRVSLPDMTLYVWPFGIAMFHVEEELTLPNLATLAVWRRKSYKEHLRLVTSRIRELAEVADAEAMYVLSLYYLADPIWTGQTLETALRILCMPKVLLDRNQDVGAEQAALIERTLLAEGFSHPEIESFGVKGISLGYASWSGVVYYPIAPDRSLTERELVTCELSTQSLWAYCAHINGEVEQGHDPMLPAEFGWRFLRASRSRLMNSRPQETGQHRSMRNAVLSTSGIVELMTQALETLRESDGG